MGLFLAYNAINSTYYGQVMEKKVRRIRNLDSISGCLSEMRKLYCETRTHVDLENMDIDSAVKLTGILKTITHAVRDNLLEQRITELENELSK